jgi:hypothetical protein
LSPIATRITHVREPEPSGPRWPQLDDGGAEVGPVDGVGRADDERVVGYYGAGAYDERTPLMREIHHEGI